MRYTKSLIRSSAHPTSTGHVLIAILINLQNGLLNIHTLEFTKHSADYLSLVQLPIGRYDPEARCPNILKFLGQVLKPKDVFTALQLFRYCHYRTSKYQKAMPCVAKGANGKLLAGHDIVCFIRVLQRLRTEI